MRLVPATPGCPLILVAYLVPRALHCCTSTRSSDPSSTVQPSSSLVFPACSGAEDGHFITKPHHGHAHLGTRPESGPFSRHWWTYFPVTGLSLDAVVSCKWVELFTIVMVGASTLMDLLGDLNVPVPSGFVHPLLPLSP